MSNKTNLATPQATDLSMVTPAWGLNLENAKLGASYQTAKNKLIQIFRGKLAKALLIGALALGGGEKLLAEDSIDLSPSTDPDRELFSPESKACITQMSNPLEIPKDRIERFKLYQDWVLTAAKGTTDKIGDSDGVLSVAGLAIEAKEFKNAVLKLIQGVGKTVIGFLGFGSEKDDSNDNSQLEDLYKKALSDLIEEEVDTMLFNDWKRSQSGRRFGGEPRVDAHQLVDQEEAPFFTGINGKILPLCEQELELAMLILLSSEDESFFGHDGADKQVMAGQAVKELAPGKEGRGASSVTMQLIKLLWPKTLNDRFRNSLEGKILQARVAIAFEDSLQETISKQFPNLNKSQVKERAKLVILTVYLNTIHFGVHRDISIEGIEMAARTYYGKSLNQLTIKEIATLVKTIPSPRNQSPAKEQKNLISSSALIKQLPTKIADLDNLPRELELLAEELLADNDNNIPSHWELNSVYRNVIPDTRIQTDLIPQHAEAIWDQVRSILAAQGKTPEQIAEIFRGKITVTLTLHRDAQRAAMAAVQEEVSDYIADQANKGIAIRQNQVQASQFIVDPITGEVLAAVTSNPNSSSSIDYTTRASGSIGSTMKPLVMAKILENYQQDLAEVERLQQATAELNATDPESPEAQEAQTRYETAQRLLVPVSLSDLLSNKRSNSGFLVRSAGMDSLTEDSAFFLGISDENVSASGLDFFDFEYPFQFPKKPLWAPGNFANTFTEESIPTWLMIQRSDNLAAIDLWLRQIYFADTATREGFFRWLNRELGFSRENINNSRGGAFVLGTGEFSAENLATAYGAISNSGMALKSDWQLIKSIEINGTTVWEAPAPQFKRVMSPQTAFLSQWALQRACQHGTSIRTWLDYLKTHYQTCAAKTGTAANFSAVNHAAIIDGLVVVSRMLTDNNLGSFGAGNSAAALAAPMTGRTMKDLAEAGVGIADLLSPPAGHEYDQASGLWLPEQFSAGFSRSDQNASLNDTNNVVQEGNATAENNQSQSGLISIPEDPVGYQRTDAGLFVPAGYVQTPTGLWQPPQIGWQDSPEITLNRFKQPRLFGNFLSKLAKRLKAFEKSRAEQISAEENATDPCIPSVDHLAGDVSAEVNSTIIFPADQNLTTEEFSAEDLADWQQVDPLCTVEGVISEVRGWFEEQELEIYYSLDTFLKQIESLSFAYSPKTAIEAIRKNEVRTLKSINSARSLRSFLVQLDLSNLSTTEVLNSIQLWEIMNPNLELPYSLGVFIEQIKALDFAYQPQSVFSAISDWFDKAPESLAILPTQDLSPRVIESVRIPTYQAGSLNQEAI